MQYAGHMSYMNLVHEFLVADRSVVRASDRCAGGHRFDSCQGIRLFSLSHAMLITSFPISLKSLTFTIILYLSYILINNDFLKHKQANINVNSRRFGIIVTPFSWQSE